MFPTNTSFTIADADRIIAAVRENDGRPHLGLAIKLGLSVESIEAFIERNREMIFRDEDVA